MWPFRPNRDSVDRSEYLRIIAERDAAREGRDTWHSAFLTANRQLAEERAANQRLSERNACLRERLERARTADRDEEFDRTLRRLERLLRACQRYRVELAVRDEQVDLVQDQLFLSLGCTNGQLRALGVAPDAAPGARHEHDCEGVRGPHSAALCAAWRNAAGQAPALQPKTTPDAEHTD